LRECRHDWCITGSNGFGHPSEEQCLKCGEYRHKIHNFDKFRNGIDEEWMPGRHPNNRPPCQFCEFAIGWGYDSCRECGKSFNPPNDKDLARRALDSE
jgi:hypothetical protein